MKLIIQCDCGNEVTVVPETYGKIAYFAKTLRDKEFDANDVKIKKELLEDVVEDVDDVKVRLKEIRIDCRVCGEYMILDCDC